jgi:hypothetical protein
MHPAPAIITTAAYRRQQRPAVGPIKPERQIVDVGDRFALIDAHPRDSSA